jgi:hypothetical protein
MTSLRLPAFAAALFCLSLLAYAPEASACACCSEPGQRVEGSGALDAYSKGELGRLRFSKKARLYTSAAGMAGVKGITDPSDTYELTQTRASDRWTFTFKDAKGRIGSVSFTLPSMMEYFFVDTQDGKPSTDPVLYKEWRLVAPATTTGVFAPAASAGSPTVRLVVQGRGNSCTFAEQLTSFSLIVSGPSAGFTIFGRLDAPGPPPTP